MNKWEVFTRIEPADRFGPAEDTEVFAIRCTKTKEPIAYFHLPEREFLDQIVAAHNQLVEKAVNLAGQLLTLSCRYEEEIKLCAICFHDTSRYTKQGFFCVKCGHQVYGPLTHTEKG
jgi:hypothetical protein